MLLSLHIENIAVIKCVDFDFSRGFVVLTGETGAGKSVVIDSINLLLGGKTERELIRTGAEQAMVSGLFGDLSERVVNELASVGVSPAEDGSILVQRTITASGQSRININGRAVSLAVLKAAMPHLVSVHGQSDTAYLVNSKNHIELLDIFANTSALTSEYRIAYDKLEKIRGEIRRVEEAAAEGERMREILEYQIKDIDSAALKSGEEDELIDKKLKLKNSEKIIKNSEFVYKALRGSEKGSVAYLLDRSSTALAQIADVTPGFAEYSERLRDVLYQIEDIAEEVYATISDIDSDPEETLNNIESRLDKISKLKRKYGLTIDDVLAFRDKCQSELDLMQNSEERLFDLKKEEKEALGNALSLADKLHKARKEALGDLEGKVKATLEFLDMPKVVFFVSVKETFKNGEKLLSKDGFDTVEFYISANRGAEPQPLSKIASGGELSRIMLALKSVIADKDGVPTVIYDEIDAGVSGKTARKIGIKMLELSKSSQLFCVTHSAQIASLADRHFLISKSDINGATETSVKTLDYEGRVSELSRILGGISVTDAQRAAAVDMLEEKKEYINS
ncbi:MAG: DNA repair protein RecN [Clostridia bacterium]|nr:DNA repair protein RecN [Clostridia bacterium]